MTFVKEKENAHKSKLIYIMKSERNLHHAYKNLYFEYQVHECAICFLICCKKESLFVSEISTSLQIPMLLQTNPVLCFIHIDLKWKK